MAYGLDISSSLSMLVGLSKKGSDYKVKKILAMPGFSADPDEAPRTYQSASLGTTFRALKNLKVNAGTPAVNVPGKEVFYRFTNSTPDKKLIEANVRMEADEIGSGNATILSDWILGRDYDYDTALQISLAREEVIDHYANSLKEMGIDTPNLMCNVAALFNAYLISGDLLDDNIAMYANIGDDNTDVILVREGFLLYSRSISFGVNDFLNGLSPEYGADRDALRQILFREIDLRPSVAADNISGNRGVRVGQEVASRLFQQISSTIMLAKGAQRQPKLDARRIFISGAGAAIPGLRELMMNRTRKTVEIFDPLKNIDLSSLDEESRALAESYRPALALGIGLAIMNTDSKAERMLFLPASVRKRREFLTRSLFLYLAAALTLAIVMPAFLMTQTAAEDADANFKVRQRSPLGRYESASGEQVIYQKELNRQIQRNNVSAQVTGPGRVSTTFLIAFAKKRPETVRLKSVILAHDTKNDGKDPKFKAKTYLEVNLFIENKGTANPTEVYKKLQNILKSIDGVSEVEPGRTKENKLVAGLDVTYKVFLDFGLEGAK
ncbi:MAG: pilus assembly protein PilM [Planctomycetes bacterium]|nr:pilus assembly protein PilM [Planctomycetota bacterium]